MNRQDIPTYPDLAGKVAFVTGGSRGIGASTCELLSANGARVAVNGRDESAIEAVVARIRSEGGEAVGFPADCTNAEALMEARVRVERQFGEVDILAAFVGGQGEPEPTENMSEERWRAVVELNLTSTFIAVQTFSPSMLARGHGSIITMASTAGRLAGLASAPYSAAKAGVVMLTGKLAKEFAPKGVRVNCLAPSAIVTSQLERLPESKLREIAAGFPLGRLGKPEDVALATLFLASESASWVTGVTLDITGGRVIV